MLVRLIELEENKRAGCHSSIALLLQLVVLPSAIKQRKSGSGKAANSIRIALIRYAGELSCLISNLLQQLESIANLLT